MSAQLTSVDLTEKDLDDTITLLGTKVYILNSNVVDEEVFDFEHFLEKHQNPKKIDVNRLKKFNDQVFEKLNEYKDQLIVLFKDFDDDYKLINDVFFDYKSADLYLPSLLTDDLILLYKTDKNHLISKIYRNRLAFEYTLLDNVPAEAKGQKYFNEFKFDPTKEVIKDSMTGDRFNFIYQGEREGVTVIVKKKGIQVKEYLLKPKE